MLPKFILCFVTISILLALGPRATNHEPSKLVDTPCITTDPKGTNG